jgi:Domain of unknown function (DUF4411)
LSTIYCSDTSTLIQSWVWDYRPSVFIGVWERLEAMVEEETRISSSEVLLELAKKQDEVHKWAKRRTKMFVQIDEAVQNEVRAVLRAYPRLIDTKKGRSGADPFVIALARIRGASVLTDERPSGNLNKPKIPDVCQALGVECYRISDMFERQGLTFK